MTRNQKFIVGAIIFMILFPTILKIFFALIIPLLIIGTVAFFILRKNYQTNPIFKKTVNQNPLGKKILDYENLVKKNLFFNFTPMNKVKIFLWVAILGSALFLILDGFVNVPAGYVAVIYDRGQGVLDQELPEGLHLKIPFWQTASLFTTKKQVFTMAGEFQGVLDEDAVRGRSKDGQDVTVDVSLTYQIQGQDASFLLQEFLSENGYRTTIVNPAARSIVYDAVSKFNALELVSEKRGEFSALILKNLKKIYADNQIILHEVFVRNVTFSPEFAKAIEEKQIAEQNIKTAEYRKAEAEQFKQKKIIEAQAEAEAIRLKGETLKANPEVIQFEFVQKMAPNINWGVLPDNIIPLLDLKGMTGKN